jgi:hypothetical protein
MKANDILLLFLLSNLPQEQKIAVLQKLTPNNALYLSEIVLNVMYKVIPISRNYKRKLRLHKEVFVSLTEKKNRKAIIAKHPEAVLLLLKSVKNTIWNFKK